MIPATAGDPQLAHFHRRPGAMVVAISDTLRERGRMNAAEITRAIFTGDIDPRQYRIRYSAVFAMLGRMWLSGDLTRTKTPGIVFWQLAPSENE